MPRNGLWDLLYSALYLRKQSEWLESRGREGGEVGHFFPLASSWQCCFQVAESLLSRQHVCSTHPTDNWGSLALHIPLNLCGHRSTQTFVNCHIIKPADVNMPCVHSGTVTDTVPAPLSHQMRQVQAPNVTVYSLGSSSKSAHC